MDWVWIFGLALKIYYWAAIIFAAIIFLGFSLITIYNYNLRVNYVGYAEFAWWQVFLSKNDVLKRIGYWFLELVGNAVFACAFGIMWPYTIPRCIAALRKEFSKPKNKDP